MSAAERIPLGHGLSRSAPEAGHRVLGADEPRTDRPPGLPPHRGHLARSCRRLAPRSLRSSWGISPRAARAVPMPPRSPCAATPTFSTASSSALAINSTSSSLSASSRKGGLAARKSAKSRSLGRSLRCFRWRVWLVRVLSGQTVLVFQSGGEQRSRAMRTPRESCFGALTALPGQRFKIETRPLEAVVALSGSSCTRPC